MGQLFDMLVANGCYEVSLSLEGSDFRRYLVPKPRKESYGISELNLSDLDSMMNADKIDCIFFAERNFYICEVSRSGEGKNFTAIYYPYEHFMARRIEDWFRIRDFLQPCLKNSEIYS